MIQVTVHNGGSIVAIQRFISRSIINGVVSRAAHDFKGKGHLVTVQGRGEHRDLGDRIAIERT